MDYKQYFTFARTTPGLVLSLLLCAAGLHAAESPPGEEPRAATLTEPQGTSVHHYNNATPTSAVAQPVKRTIQNHLLWLYEVTIGLTQDHDSDGHYSTFSITLDFDTTLHTPLVYAVLYVSNGNGPWYEYAVTGNFRVNSAGSNDAYTIHASLDSGYPTGLYNHHIEVYDANSNHLLASYGPQDNYSFHNLPFESSIHDQTFGISSSISLNFTGAGAIPPSALLVLPVLVAARRYRSKHR